MKNFDPFSNLGLHARVAKPRSWPWWNRQEGFQTRAKILENCTNFWVPQLGHLTPKICRLIYDSVLVLQRADMVSKLKHQLFQNLGTLLD